MLQQQILTFDVKAFTFSSRDDIRFCPLQRTSCYSLALDPSPSWLTKATVEVLGPELMESRRCIAFNQEAIT